MKAILKLNDTLGIMNRSLSDSMRSVGNYKSRLESLLFKKIKVKGKQYARPFYLNLVYSSIDPIKLVDTESGKVYTELAIYELTNKKV